MNIEHQWDFIMGGGAYVRVSGFHDLVTTDGSYHCSVFNSNMNRGHCIKESNPFHTRYYRNGVFHKDA